MIFFATKKRSTFLNHWDRRQRVLSWYHEYLLHPGQTRTEKTIRNNITWPGLTQDVEHWYSTCQVCQMTNKERKKYGLLPPKIAESDIVSLGHGLCGSGGSIYNKDTSQNTLSACTHNDRSRNAPLVGLKLLKLQIRQQHPSRICFITPGWHITHNLNLLSLTMWVWANSNVSSNKCVTIMALKPNQLQVTTNITQANTVI
jgi:hypothetical protein